jgi:transglutaminase-like putative cysteine protease
MTRKARELELLLLAAFAAVPLYFTNAIGAAPLLLFHGAMLVLALRVAAGRSPQLLPAIVMRGLAIVYIPFYFVDWLLISHSAIAASTHLVLFIAVYQPSETMQRSNHAQRLLTAALIFIASIATSTHITIVLFVIGFAYLTLRQLMYVSHLETAQSVGREYSEPPLGRAALFYVVGTVLIAAVLFPFLPRVRNPFVQGFAGNLGSSTTGLSDTIDFREPRVSPLDATIVARIWMPYASRPFFLPMRLRGNVYDEFKDGVWRTRPRGLRPLMPRDDGYFLTRRNGIEGSAIIQTRTERGRLFLPNTAYRVDGIGGPLYEGPGRDMYYAYSRSMVTLDVRMAMQTEPIRPPRIGMSGYPIPPEVAALARRIVGTETRPEKRAALIEEWMVRNFRYVPNPATPPAMTIERFLLRDRIGHCEYFAAGMVVLLNALDVPARIAGGYYGGRLNPLMGYFTIRRDDAHAWTEVWDGKRWLTFDSTPPSLRPGSEESGIRAYASALGDSVTYFWDRYILTFGLADQVTLFTDLLTAAREAISVRTNITAARLKNPSFAIVLVVLAACAFLYMRRRRSLFDLLARRLKQHGVEVSSAMTVEDALRLLQAQDREEFAPLIALYEEAVFSASVERRASARRNALRRITS